MEYLLHSYCAVCGAMRQPENCGQCGSYIGPVAVLLDVGEEFLNLTPHDVVVHASSGPVIIPASGTVARVATVAGDEDVTYEGVRILHRSKPGAITGLPETTKVLLIVSGMVASAARASGHPLLSWLVSPGTGPEHRPERDSKGNITAVHCLVRA